MPLRAIRSATAGQNELVQTIAVPRDHRATRIPSFPALERTSVLSFTDTFTLVTDVVVDADDPGTRIGIVRDPVFPVWKRFNVSGSYSSFRLQGLTTMVFSGRDFITLNYEPELYTNPGVGWPCTGMPLYVLDGKEYSPLTSNNGAVEMSFVQNPGATVLSVTGYYLDSAMDPISFSTSGPGVAGTSSGRFFAALTFDMPDGAFAMRVEMVQVTTSNTVTGYAIYVGSTTSDNADAFPLTTPRGIRKLSAMLPITTATEYKSAPVVWQSTRANSVAVLFSNVSAVLQKEGTVNSARVPMETGITLYNSDNWISDFTKVHPKERYFGPLEKGLYTFTLPDAVSEVYREYDNIGVSLPAYKHYLNGNRFCHCVLFRDPDHLASLAVTVDRHVEFKSNSVLFPYGFSTTPLEAYHQAQMALANLGVFYENPTHLGTIAALARQAVVKYGPRVAQAALPYAVRGANQLLSTINAKLGQMKQAGLSEGKRKKEKKKVSVKPRPKTQGRRRRVLS